MFAIADRLSGYHAGVLLALVGTALFSFKSIIIKLAYEYQIDSLQLIVLRMLFAAPFYIGLLLFLSHKKRIQWQGLKRYKWLVLAAGLMGYYLASFLDLWGLELISAQLERLLLFTYPGFVMLLAWLFWRQKPSSNTWTALLITYLGIVMVVGVEGQQQWDNVLFGAGLVLVSAFLFAGYLILSRTGIAALGSQAFTCIAMLIATVAVMVHLSLVEPQALWTLAWQAYVLAAVLAFFCTVIPSLLIAAAIARLGPEKTSVLGGSGPVMTAVLAVFILQEPFGWWHLAGTLLVASGAVIVAREKQR